MKYLYTALLLLCSTISWAQNSFTAVIEDVDTHEPLPGATLQIKGTDKGAVADLSGKLSLQDIPDGTHTFIFSYVGYEDKQLRLSFPYQGPQPLELQLESGEELEEIIVTATRGSRTLNDIPTRVEVLAAEELGEKAVMNSTNIAMLLRESTGIQMQQTSPNSANQSIRIQGLDGRYTQIIQDGFPLYSGFSSGLSIMQIPPLDLQQVEVIKGSASTLYGGGAIAGLINLVTKKPAHDPELSLMLNQTSADGTTLNGFYAQRWDKGQQGGPGMSMYTSANRQQAYDPDGDGFSNIPEVRSLTVAPRFFYYFNESSTLWAGVRGTFEERTGGNMQVLENEQNTGFTEQNLSNRVSSQLQFSKVFDQNQTLLIKNSLNYFEREIKIPDYNFNGQQLGSFSEASYAFGQKESRWITGLNLFTDHFEQLNRTGFGYSYTTAGAFAQHIWELQPDIVFESGLRTDYNLEHGLFALPRASLLYRFHEKWSGRLGGGLGYKLPTIFTEEAERLSFKGIQPLGPEVKAETSEGINFDLDYQTALGSKATFSLNQLFYYTRLHNSLMLRKGNGSSWFYENARSPVYSQGFETNMRFTYLDFKLFLQYAFIDARLQENGITFQKPLTPKHNAGAVFMFEQHGKWRVGYELYYTGPQYLSDGSRTPDYWIMGLMTLREFEHFSLFLNFENFLDTRQSRFSPLLTSAPPNPEFAEIWAPTDGFVVNGGFILKLFPERGHH
jgi:outer membrane receptor for ferrienterochelin and colicins